MRSTSRYGEGRTTEFSSGAGCKRLHATKRRNAGHVCCNGWFGPEALNVPDASRSIFGAGGFSGCVAFSTATANFPGLARIRTTPVSPAPGSQLELAVTWRFLKGQTESLASRALAKTHRHCR